MGGGWAGPRRHRLMWRRYQLSFFVSFLGTWQTWTGLDWQSETRGVLLMLVLALLCIACGAAQPSSQLTAQPVVSFGPRGRKEAGGSFGAFGGMAGWRMVNGESLALFEITAVRVQATQRQSQGRQRNVMRTAGKAKQGRQKKTWLALHCIHDLQER